MGNDIWSDVARSSYRSFSVDFLYIFELSELRASKGQPRQYKIGRRFSQRTVKLLILLLMVLLSLPINDLPYQQLSGPHAVVAYAVNIFSGIIVDKRAASFTAISVGAIKILGSVLAIGFLKKKVSKRLQVNTYLYCCKYMSQ